MKAPHEFNIFTGCMISTIVTSQEINIFTGRMVVTNEASPRIQYFDRLQGLENEMLHSLPFDRSCFV
jgi:hypothetical protein